MIDEQYPLKFYNGKNYLPVPEMDMDRSSYESPSFNSTWRKYAPFGVHISLMAVVAATFLLCLDGRSFNIDFRRPQYQEVDGSVSHLTSYAPLQSDVATAASIAASVTRVAAGGWLAGNLWRCIFVSMERGGISLEGISQLVSQIWPAPAHRHFARKSNMVIIYTTLFFTFAIDYFSAALTGSLVWEPTNRLIPGNIQLTGILKGVSGARVADYFTFDYNQRQMVEVGSASANLVWATLQPSTSSTTEPWLPTTTFRRIIQRAQHLSTNSTLANVTIPYFIVDDFRWITDPVSVLTQNQIALLSNYSNFSPYFSDRGIGGLLPDSLHWGPQQIEKLGDPLIVSESRLFAYRTERRFFNTGAGPCPQNYMVDPGSQINLYQLNYVIYYDCFAFANFTYRAGAAMCNNCRVVSPSVVEGPSSSLQLIPDSFTTMALGFASSLGTNLIFTNYSIPQNFGTRKNFAIAMTSRAYQAAWAAFSDSYGNQADFTAVMVAVPTLRAKVIAWRVYLWVALHFLVWVLGLLFVYFQSYCDHPWVEDPSMAVFWLNTTPVLSGTAVDPWQPGSEIPYDGMIILDKADQGLRSVIKK